MKFIQQTNIDNGTFIVAATDVSATARELEWLIEGLDALILPDQSKRIKRALKRALADIRETFDD